MRSQLIKSACIKKKKQISFQDFKLEWQVCAILFLLFFTTYDFASKLSRGTTCESNKPMHLFDVELSEKGQRKNCKSNFLQVSMCI